jgi:L,D-transpeptidase catalytic domain
MGNSVAKSALGVGISLSLYFLSICHASASLGSWADVERQVAGKYPTISRPALERAFEYLNEHSDEIHNQNYLTVIDFDLPSTAERMYVIDLKDVTMSSYLVAHGKDSGDLYATEFSNAINSNKSSLGIYWTGNEYIGEHGLSMVLQGKEETNSNAEARVIVLHGADYVSYDFIKQTGRLGRSLGCTAVSLQYSSDLVRKLEGGSVFYVHHSRTE